MNLLQINCSFELSLNQRILKKCVTVSTKILSSTAVFNTDNKKCFLSTKSAFYNDFEGTLKTGVMAAENSDLPSHKNNCKAFLCLTNLNMDCFVILSQCNAGFAKRLLAVQTVSQGTAAENGSHLK